MRKQGVLLILLVLVSAGAATAASGTVLDEAGRPVDGASACLLENGLPMYCDDTDTNGYYTLPDTQASSVRIRKSGYLPATVAAVPQEAPVVLSRAASLRARVVDAATGKPIGGGRIVVLYPSGRVLDDFPFKLGGTHVATIEPGAVKVRAELEGFSGEVVEVTLEPGREASIELKVRKER